MLKYIKEPRSVGALLPSSRYLARKMVGMADFDRCQVIVEYGPGTGVFTDAILRKKKPETKLLLFESNIGFAGMLERKYRDNDSLVVINESAENVGLHLNSHGFCKADCVLSGLPFASLHRGLSERILAETYKHLSPGGIFITFQYTLFMKAFITGHFDSASLAWEPRNIPPAFVIGCLKQIT